MGTVVVGVPSVTKLIFAAGRDPDFALKLKRTSFVSGFVGAETVPRLRFAIIVTASVGFELALAI